MGEWVEMTDDRIDDLAEICANLVVRYGCVAFAVGALTGFLLGLWVG